MQAASYQDRPSHQPTSTARAGFASIIRFASNKVQSLLPKHHAVQTIPPPAFPHQPAHQHRIQPNRQDNADPSDQGHWHQLQAGAKRHRQPLQLRFPRLQPPQYHEPAAIADPPHAAFRAHAQQFRPPHQRQDQAQA